MMREFSCMNEMKIKREQKSDDRYIEFKLNCVANSENINSGSSICVGILKGQTLNANRS